MKDQGVEEGQERGRETEAGIEVTIERKRIDRVAGIENINPEAGIDPGVEIKRINLAVEVRTGGINLEAEDGNIHRGVNLEAKTERIKEIDLEAEVQTRKKGGDDTAPVLGAARSGGGIVVEIGGRINHGGNGLAVTAVQIPIKTGRVKMEIMNTSICFFINCLFVSMFELFNISYLPAYFILYSFWQMMCLLYSKYRHKPLLSHHSNFKIKFKDYFNF